MTAEAPTQSAARQRLLDEALFLAALLVDAPVTHPEDEALARDIIARLRPHLTYETLYSRELVFALQDYARGVADGSVAAPLRRLEARERLKRRLHSVLRRKLGAVLEELEQRGVEVRGGLHNPDSPEMAETAAPAGAAS